MKIEKIEIDKLFGYFDHSIEINREGITIVIGENGLGKTIFLEIIEAFFSSNFSYLYSVEFEQLRFTFSDGVTWRIKKIENSYLEISQHKTSEKPQYKPFQIKNYSDEEFRRLIRYISRDIPIRKYGSDMWIDERTNKIFTSQELYDMYSGKIRNIYSHGQNLLFEEDLEQPKWFSERISSININLIETQRLIQISRERNSRYNEISTIKTVEKYSQELQLNINSLLTTSTTLSSKLDKTYPNRLIDALNNSENREISEEEILNGLRKLEKKRELLTSVGLFSLDSDATISKIDYPGRELKYVLKLYVEDSFRKLEIFDDFAKKIELFRNIINKRFKHKKLFIDQEKGFIFKSDFINSNNNIIPNSKLSSGEQNELVLFYRLIFNSDPNSLILIDEPEISLHISWQKSFIKDLKDITQLNGTDIIIATHSPDIIGNNWDLRVELKGLE